MSSAGIINLNISDHMPIYLIRKKSKDNRAKICFKGRSYAGYSKVLLSDCLTNRVKEGFRQSADPNECWDLMEGFLLDFLDQTCPIKTFRTRDNTPAWITHDIITLSKDRDAAWARASTTNREVDWDMARRLRNWANNAVKAAKADFLQAELDRNKRDPRMFWRNIKCVLPDQVPGSIEIANPLNQEPLPKDQQAQTINDFFAGIGEKLASKFVTDVPNVVPEIPPEDRLHIKHITRIEVQRPISLLPVPGKLLEKYITDGIQNYLELKEVFSEYQNGFRTGKSTTSALTTFLDDLLVSLNESKTCIIAYLDVQKAFDTINHNILLNKLRTSGIGEELCSLLKNYLTNRQQKTKLHGHSSGLKPITVGVPQGSIIGPTMFILYINDLSKVLQFSKPLMYADDTVLYVSSSNKRDVRKKLQIDLNNVERWCRENRLSLNVSKTKIMTFMSDHARKKYVKFRLNTGGREIEEVDTYKYLGTHIDNKLNGEDQYSKTMQTLGYKLRTFGRIRRFLDTNAALTVYKSTILPLIDYNDQFQFLWNSEKLQKLQKMQTWGLRTVFNNRAPKLDEAELHLEAKLTTLNLRRVLHLLGLMYHRSKVERFLDKRDIHTRQFDKVKFKVINPVVKRAFKSPNYLGAQLWDMLPADTQNVPTFQLFKYRVKGHITAGLFDKIP